MSLETLIILFTRLVESANEDRDHSRNSDIAQEAAAYDFCLRFASTMKTFMRAPHQYSLPDLQNLFEPVQAKIDSQYESAQQKEIYRGFLALLNVFAESVALEEAVPAYPRPAFEYRWSQAFPYQISFPSEADAHSWAQGTFSNLDEFIGADLDGWLIYKNGKLLIEGKSGFELAYNKDSREYEQREAE